MKTRQIIPLLLLSLVTVTLSSCLGKDSEQRSLALALYSRSIDLENPDTDNAITFSGATCRFDVRNTSSEQTMSITLLAKLNDNTSIDFQTDYMPLTPGTNGTHTFSLASTQQLGHTITNLNGTIDFNGVVYLEYLVDGRYRVSTTTTPYYQYGLVELLPPGMQPVNFTESPVTFGVTTTGGNTGVLRIYNITIDGTKYHAIQFEKLAVKPTLTGYTLQSEATPLKAVEPDDNTHMVTGSENCQVDVQATDNARALTGEITIGDKKIHLNMKMFQ